MNRRPLTKSRHLTCVAGNYHSPGPSGRSRGNYSSELSGQSELPFGRRQTVQRAGGLPRRSSPGPAGPLTCRRRKIGAHDALPSRRRFCVFWESAVLLPRQESFASLHILTRRASEGSEALSSLARRVSMSLFGARVIPSRVLLRSAIQNPKSRIQNRTSVPWKTEETDDPFLDHELLVVSEQDGEARRLIVLVIRERFGDAEPAHHLERDMVDDAGLPGLATVVSGPCFPRSPGRSVRSTGFLEADSAGAC